MDLHLSRAVAFLCVLVAYVSVQDALAQYRPPISVENSTLPVVIVGAPDGSIVSSVIVRGWYLDPVPGSSVSIDFGTCAAFRPCPLVCTGCTIPVSTHAVMKFTDAGGKAAFDLRMGADGCPAPPLVRVYADGVYLGSPKFASLDQDGDLSVTDGDVAMVQALVGTNDLRADFDGDGTVTASDVARVQAHLGTTCSVPTPVRRSTWGGLKSLYR